MVKDQEGDNRLSSVVGKCLFSSREELVASTFPAAPEISVWVFVQACVHVCMFVCARVCFVSFAIIQRSSFLYSAGAPQSCEAGGSLYNISLTPFFMLKYLSQTGSTGTFAH